MASETHESRYRFCGYWALPDTGLCCIRDLLCTMTDFVPTLDDDSELLNGKEESESEDEVRAL